MAVPMTFRDFCRPLDVKWVGDKVWTVDGASSTEGEVLIISGLLTTHDDLLEILCDEPVAPYGVPFHAVATIVERSDSQAKVLESEELS